MNVEDPTGRTRGRDVKDREATEFNIRGDGLSVWTCHSSAMMNGPSGREHAPAILRITESDTLK
jgi:hypothetical protein